MKRKKRFNDEHDTFGFQNKRRKYSPDYDNPPIHRVRHNEFHSDRYPRNEYPLPRPPPTYDLNQLNDHQPIQRRNQNLPIKRSRYSPPLYNKEEKKNCSKWGPPKRQETPNWRRNNDFHHDERERRRDFKRKSKGGNVERRNKQIDSLLEKRKNERNEISNESIAHLVFTESPKREINKDGFVYDLKKMEEEENAELESREMREKQRREKKKKDSIKKKKENALFKKEFEERLKLEKQVGGKNSESSNGKKKIPGPKKLEQFEKEMAFHGERLLPGEGEAMSKFLSTGKRIPRRGELLSEERINELESLGYVMSGNRHKRMSEVRKQKEEAVKNIYEKYMLDYEKFMERQKKEVQIRSKLRKLVIDQKNKDNI